MISDCEKCLWHGQCYISLNCDDFTPIEEDVDLVVENDRYDYRIAFFTYEEENQND